ncbi:MAG: hypothetical protein RLZZ283_192 [Candidatus Parcubacteria bacterium]|jgi:hypothetical protein
MSWETLAKIARGDRPKIESQPTDTGALVVIQHPGFANPVAIANETFRQERMIEDGMRGGWSRGEAIQRLREKGKID